MTTPTMESEADGSTPGEVAASAAGGLARIAAQLRLFRSADGPLHVRVPVAGRDQLFGLKSAEFREWLTESVGAECGQLPSARSVRHVISGMAARARFDEVLPEIRVRIGREDRGGGDDCYLDLGDATGKAVRFNAQEWAIATSSPVQFKRPMGMLPLPEPRTEGSIELLRRYVNVTDRDFRLLIGWMASALLPEGPYPILAIHGEQGSAKSTLAKVVRSLIDPQTPPVLAEPRSARDLMVTASGGWILAYDNISKISGWLSDGFCRLATGGGYAGRANYSDDARHAVAAQRPLMLNGIDDFVHRDDLADRCVFLNLPPIEPAGRRAEGEFWRSFEADRPAILGGLLDALVGGLRELSSVRLTELPRMADFACLGEAVGRALGWAEGTFLATYSENRHESTVIALEESVLATVLLDSAALGGLRGWTLSATEMLDELAREVPRRLRASTRWPNSPRAFANELRRIAPGLRGRGISVKFTKTRDNRLITIDADRSFDYSRAPHCSNLDPE
jgi:hypothetical protein